MFDPEGEREFLEECKSALAERTVILISHRPAGIELADRIIRMEPGKPYTEYRSDAQGPKAHAQ